MSLMALTFVEDGKRGKLGCTKRKEAKGRQNEDVDLGELHFKLRFKRSVRTV